MVSMHHLFDLAPVRAKHDRTSCVLSGAVQGTDNFLASWSIRERQRICKSLGFNIRKSDVTFLTKQF